MREKRGGIWQVLTWSDYAALVSRFAAGLAAHGFGRGDRLAVIGDNRPRLYAAMLAAQSLGGAVVPSMARCGTGLDRPGAEPCRRVRRGRGGCRAGGQARRDQGPGCPRLRLVVQTAAHGMRQAEYGWLKSFEAVADAGMRRDDAVRSRRSPHCCVAPTGAGGEVRGVTLSHAEPARRRRGIGRHRGHQADRRDARLAADGLVRRHARRRRRWHLSVGFTCNCPENPETARRDLREIGPTILIAPPRIWENTLADIETRAAQASRVEARAVRRLPRDRGTRRTAPRRRARTLPPLLQLKLALGEVLVYAPMRDQIGLRRLRWANTCGEPLAPRVLHGLARVRHQPEPEQRHRADQCRRGTGACLNSTLTSRCC